MAKDKFKKRKQRRRKIRWAMEDLGLKGTEMAASLGVDPSLISNVIAGRAKSARVVAALVKAGVPAKLFGEIPPTPL